jgi:hypothetical protein
MCETNPKYFCYYTEASLKICDGIIISINLDLKNNGLINKIIKNAIK